jgi:pimeloyl-ACP methyl ester carboxylesterase
MIVGGILMRLAKAGAVLVVCAMSAGCVSAEVRLSHFMSPDRGARTAAIARGYAVQDLIIHRADRLIGVTHAHHPQSHAVIVFFGGNDFHQSIDGGEALEVLARDADVLLFDYPGYGDSTGSPTPAVMLETALAVYDYAASLETSSGKKRVLYGFSLGGMVAAQVARDRVVDAVVLEATASNVEAWARSRVPWFARPLVTLNVEPQLAAIDSFAALREFRGDVLILASRGDVQAPASLSQALHTQLRRAGVNAELVLFRKAAHGGIPHTPEFTPVFRQFISRTRVSP